MQLQEDAASLKEDLEGVECHMRTSDLHYSLTHGAEQEDATGKDIPHSMAICRMRVV